MRRARDWAATESALPAGEADAGGPEAARRVALLTVVQVLDEILEPGSRSG